MNHPSKNETIHINIAGVVQGVGFRPFIARMAGKVGISGFVRNTGGRVDIMASGKPEELSQFITAIREQSPANAHIDVFETSKVPFVAFPDFVIQGSESDNDIPNITPDIAVCEDCLNELNDRTNRRYRHPFISCASCGPRYSIIDNVPYDRCNTSMVDFPMCPTCALEYETQTDRRFHAQTVSCHDCGPSLLYRIGGGNKSELTHEAAFKAVVAALREGGVVAVKGIGGYHFVCSPFDSKALINLRQLKVREAKPFAVCFQTIEQVKQYCLTDGTEAELLASPARPIVLLARHSQTMDHDVCRESRYLGAFLAYTPLQAMLIEACGPLVMTSANLSGSPVIKDDEAMLAVDSPLLAGVLYNQREIKTMLDDSVACVNAGEVQLIRRARGYVPGVIHVPMAKSETAVFAAGADLKSTFCVSVQGQFFQSQHFGDLDNADVMDAYADNVDRLCKILKIKPEIAVSDLHPLYNSARFAEKLGIKQMKVQHHHAHIASVMAEHGITGPVLGIAFDGTGYGTDGAIWGGEFLLCEGAGFERVGQLAYTDILGSDSAMTDCGVAKACLLHSLGLDNPDADSRHPLIKAALEKGIGTVKTSSMGRLFDAVSSILGICETNTYEGLAAILLENAAAEAIQTKIVPFALKFDIIQADGRFEMGAKPVIEALLAHRGKESPAALALGFHQALAQAVRQICVLVRAHTGVKTVAISGGVFQNRILLSLCKEGLRQAGFAVFTNNQVPPNDGGISLGQAFLASLTGQ